MPTTGDPCFRLFVRLTPRGGRDAVEGWGRDSSGRPFLNVRVAAPPVDGAANAALVRLMAKVTNRPARAVHIESGAHARLKQVVIDGIDDATAAALLGHVTDPRKR